VVNVAALRVAGGELDHVALAQGITGVRDKETRFLGVVFPNTLVPKVVAEGDSDGALHAPDRDDGAGLPARGVVAEHGGPFEWLRAGCLW